MNYYGKTDIGKKRAENQDCFGYKELDGMTVFAVCDGMGGTNGGAIASRLALDSFLSACERDLKPTMEYPQIRRALSAAISETNSSVFRKASQNEDLKGMGTTLVATLVTNSNVFIINVGDSRAYSVSENEFEQVSHDHSYVQLLIDLGDITPEEAETHPDRHVITKAIGISETLTPDIDLLEMDNPSYILLCSDGLTNHLEEPQLSEIVCADTDVSKKAEALVENANALGGTDNITAVVISL